jgi:uncharacterized heparinase superfamily protein
MSIGIAVSRAYEFGRHIPVAKFVRRTELSLRRFLRERIPFVAKGRTERLVRSPDAPTPIFPPRRGRYEIRSGIRHFKFIGHAEIMAGPSIDWNCPGPEPKHQLWRMNLHYMEYLEEAIDADWERLVNDWIVANPSKGRGAWKDSWNSYTISVRCVVWMQEIARRGARLKDDVVREVEASLVEQLLFLEQNLETDIGGNHLIKNIKALILASAFFEGPAANRWRAHGLALLAGEIATQVLRDGMHYERSPSYHCQVFADLLEIRHVLGDSFPLAALDGALQRMARAIGDMAHPDGAVAQFNDAGLTMAFYPIECLDAYGRLSEALPAPASLFAFPDAGYFGLRTRDVYFVADCGRVAPDDLPAHGHCDVLSFELSLGGVRFIVDPGVFEYIAGERRQLSRATASHNTLTLEGFDQADFFGSFRCGRRPNVQVRESTGCAEKLVFEGSHDGFIRLPGRPVHVRRFEANNEGLVVCDKLEGSTDRAASLGFLLHPEASVRCNGKMVSVHRDLVNFSMESTLPIEIEDAIWWPDMGVEKKTKRLRLLYEDVTRPAITTFKFNVTH